MKKIARLFIVLFLFFSGLQAQDVIPFDQEHWTIYSGKIGEQDGRQAFTGMAMLQDVTFGEGTIEWDLWATGGRSYAGVFFRQQANRDFEEIYVRPHQGNGLLYGAFQYTPAWHGVACWQLYHGDGCTRAAVIPEKQWIHFKLIVQGTRAQLTMSGEGIPETSMMIHVLAHGDISGALGVKGPADGSTWFSNFKYTPLVEAMPDPVVAPFPVPGVIHDWEITQALLHDRVNQYVPYSELADLEWTSFEAEEDGLVNLTKAVVRNRVQPGWVYARTTIHADEEGIHRYQIAYSDYLTVFLNGQPIFSSINAYLSRDPGFAGLIGWFDEVLLPLKKGENELVLLVGEQFGGWGFKVRDGEAEVMEAGLSKKWEIKHQLNFPESAVYDQERDVIYVSNNLKGQMEFLSKLSPDGKIIELEWVKGLRRPTGICMNGGMIFVVERPGIAIIDPCKGEITKRIRIEGAVALNDIAAGEDNETIYVTDPPLNRIYRIKNGEVEIFMEGSGLLQPNGIHLDGDRLLIGSSGDSSLKSVALDSKEVITLATIYPGAIMDGIQPVGDGRVLFTDWNGILFLLENDGKYRELLNTTSAQISLADFEWIPEKKLLIIPGLYSNVIACYHLDLADE